MELDERVHYSVERLDRSNEGDWNSLLMDNRFAGFFHSLRYKEAILDSGSSTTYYFLVYRDNEPVALCPFYGIKWSVKGLFTWGVLKCVQYIVVKYTDDVEIARQIVSKCKEILETEGLRLTNITMPRITKDLFININLHPAPLTGPVAGRMVLDLNQHSLQEVWSSFSKKDRRRIRLPEERGWTFDLVTSEMDLEIFYKYYKENLDYIRSRIPTTKFSTFLHLMKTFSSNEMIIFILRKNQTVAGGLLLYLYDVKKTMIMEYAALNRKLPNTYTPTYALFWHAVKKASEMGYYTIDFGGTPNNPNDIHYRIKEKFQCYYEQKYEISFPRTSVMIDSALSHLTRRFE